MTEQEWTDAVIALGVTPPEGLAGYALEQGCGPEEWVKAYHEFNGRVASMTPSGNGIVEMEDIVVDRIVMPADYEDNYLSGAGKHHNIEDLGDLGYCEEP